MGNQNEQKFQAESGSVIESRNSSADRGDRVEEHLTEVAKLSLKLDQQTRFFDAILSSINDFAYIFDKEGRFLFINQALLDLWGLKLEDATGKNFFELNYPDELAARLQRQIQLVFESQQRVTDETPYTSPTGVVGYYEYIFSPFFGADGSVEFVVGTTRNITERKEAEEKIRLLSERNLEILESISDAFFAVDSDWRFTYVNPQAERLLNRKPGDLFGQVLWDVYLGLIGSEFEQAYLRAAKERVASSVIAYYPDHERWYEVYVYPAPNGITIYFKDVTERIQLDETLRQAQAETERQRRLYDTILSNMQDLAYVFDLNHRFTYANDILLKMWGKTWEEAIGKTCLELGYEPWHAEMHDREIEQVIASKQPIRGEVPFTGTFGRRIYDYIFVPIIGANGEVEAVAGTTRDVTERKLTEQALRESEEHLRYTVELNPQTPWTASADGNIESFSERWLDLTGLTEETALGEGWINAPHPDDLSRMQAAWVQAIKTGEPYDIEHRIRLHDGSFRWMRSRAFPRRNQSGEIVRWYGTTEDIHEQKVAQEALKESDRRKDEFLATLAHELRNPLAPIRSGLEIIRRVGEDKAKLEETLDIIERQTNQIVHLVDDLLDISRITQGKIKLRKERIELKTAIKIALETSHGLINEAANELTVSLPDKPIFIEADLTRIAQIFLNILNNAAKYSDPGGRISLTASVAKNEAVIRIKDTGLGIPPEMLSKIFDMFGQIETPDEQGRGGLGIGLSVVKKLVDMHGGRVEAFSEGSGKGSEFVVHLPLAAEQSESLPAQQPSKTDILQTAQMKMPGNGNDIHSQSVAKQQRILVVDDNTDAAEMLETLLSFEGHKLRTAFDGETGIQVAAEFHPHICLLDIGLPEMNGYELAVRLRELLPQALLISVSGWGREEDRRRSREAGFDFHLVKPVEFDELLKLIQQKTTHVAQS